MVKILIFICFSIFLSFSSTIAADLSKEELIAKNWEKAINNALEQKYAVRARIYMGKSEKIIDVDRNGSILILTLKDKSQVALLMPFKTTDKDGNPIDLFFEFEK